MPEFFTPPTILLFILSIFLASAFGTRLILWCAKRCGWVAMPNHRSSHKVPTPREGGLTIGAVFFTGLVVLWMLKIVPQPLALAFIGGGLMITIVSWFDDRRNVHVGIRLAVQFIAVAWALFFIGDMATMNIGWRLWHLDFLTHLVPLGMVWMVNMYNFMDGIDGLAGSEALIVGGVAGGLLALSGSWDLALISWVLAAAAGGFLVFNWPPAKIFMSDVGSILIGFAFIVLAVASERSGAMPLLIWLILLMVFVVDASFTTIRRFIKGEKWFAGHHNFGFQQFLKRGLSHKQVTLSIIGVNIVLAALAVLSWREPVLLLPSFIVALVALSMVWWRIQSRESKRSVISPDHATL